MKDDKHDGSDDRRDGDEEGVEEGENGDRESEPACVDGDGHDEDEDEREDSCGQEETKHPVGDEVDQVQDVVDVCRKID